MIEEWHEIPEIDDNKVVKLSDYVNRPKVALSLSDVAERRARLKKKQQAKQVAANNKKALAQMGIKPKQKPHTGFWTKLESRKKD